MHSRSGTNAVHADGLKFVGIHPLYPGPLPVGPGWYGAAGQGHRSEFLGRILLDQSGCPGLPSPGPVARTVVQKPRVPERVPGFMSGLDKPTIRLKFVNFAGFRAGVQCAASWPGIVGPGPGLCFGKALLFTELKSGA